MLFVHGGSANGLSRTGRSPQLVPLSRRANSDLWHNDLRRASRRWVSSETDMTASQQQRGWFRLAFAAVAIALLVTLASQHRSGSAGSSTRITLSPVSASSSLAVRWTRWEWRAATHATSADYGVWTAILPVLFIGLMASLAFVFISTASTTRHASVPDFNSLFQRPPPAQTL